MKRGRESKKQEEGRKKIWKKSYNHLEADKAFIFLSKEEGRRKKREGRRKKERKGGTNKRDQVIGSAVLAATSNSRGTQHVGSLFCY